MPNKTIFTFNSFDHLGCKIYTDRNIQIGVLTVRAVQPSTPATSLTTEPLGRENIIDEIKGETEVSGCLFSITDDVDFNDTYPFTIWVRLEDVGVELIIVDCRFCNVSEHVAGFTASVIVDWHPIGQCAGAKTIPPNQPVQVNDLSTTSSCQNKKLLVEDLVDSWKLSVATAESHGEVTLTLVSPSGLASPHKYYRTKINEMLRGIHDLSQDVRIYSVYTVDQRYGQDQIRYDLLAHAVSENNTLESLVEQSGLTVRELQAVCLGKTILSYHDISRLVKALAGDHVELMVTIPWEQCGQKFPEDPVASNRNEKETLARECAKLLQYCQEKGIVP